MKMKISKERLDVLLHEIQVDLKEGVFFKLNMGTFGGGSACWTSATGNKECGTVACIGGALSLKLGRGLSNPLDYIQGLPKVVEARLDELFYPNYITKVWYKITSKQAIRAIQNVRDGEKYPWANVPGIKEVRP